MVVVTSSRPTALSGREDAIFSQLPAHKPTAYEKVLLDASGLPPEEREKAWSDAIVNGKYYSGIQRTRDAELVDAGLNPTEKFEIVILGTRHIPAAMKKLLALGYKTAFTTWIDCNTTEKEVCDNLVPYRAPGVVESIVEGEKKTMQSNKRALVVGDKHTLEYDIDKLLPKAEILISNGVNRAGVNLEFVHPDNAVNIPATEMKAGEFLEGVGPEGGHHLGVYELLRMRLREYERAGIKVTVRGLETSCLPKQ